MCVVYVATASYAQVLLITNHVGSCVTLFIRLIDDVAFYLSAVCVSACVAAVPGCAMLSMFILVSEKLPLMCD